MNKNLKILALIIILGMFVRFYNLADTVNFEFDDQYNSYLVYNLVKSHKISLVGQETSFGGMFLGPWHYLYLTPFYIVTNLHPIGGYIGEGMLGILAIISYYYIGSRLFSPQVGILAAFFRSVLISFRYIDLNIGPAFPAELTSIWFIYFLVKLYQGKSYAFIALSFLFGLMFSVHLVALPLIFVWLIFLIIFKPIKLNPKLIVKSLVVFLVPLLPLLLFEVKHHFAHVKSLLSLLASEGGKNYQFLERLNYEVFFIVSQFVRIFTENYLPWWIGLVFLVAIIYQLFKKKEEFDKKYHLPLFAITCLTIFIYYLIYPRHVPEYYFLSLVPIVTLYVSALLITLAKNYLSKLVVGLIILGVIFVNFRLWQGIINNPNKFALAQKDQAVKAIVDHHRDKGEFSISYFTQFGRQYGFQYFFTYYGLEPRKEIKLPIYSLVLPRSQVAQEDLSTSFGDIGVIFPEKEPEQGM